MASSTNEISITAASTTFVASVPLFGDLPRSTGILVVVALMHVAKVKKSVKENIGSVVQKNLLLLLHNKSKNCFITTCRTTSSPSINHHEAIFQN
ncbi:hypothetical protein Tco_0177046 [Tanacetum coccineum]